MLWSLLELVMTACQNNINIYHNHNHLNQRHHSCSEDSPLGEILWKVGLITRLNLHVTEWHNGVAQWCMFSVKSILKHSVK